MTYTKTVWKNRIVENPRTFKLNNNSDGTVTLEPKEGEVIEQGTSINAEKMNNIENGIENLESQMAEITTDKLNKDGHDTLILRKKVVVNF